MTQEQFHEPITKPLIISHIHGVRHGESQLNLIHREKLPPLKILLRMFKEQVPADEEAVLTPTGREQISLQGDLVAIELAEIPRRNIHIMSSTFARARESTGIILERVNAKRPDDEKIANSEVMYNEALVEKRMGITDLHWLWGAFSDDETEQRVASIAEEAIKRYRQRVENNPLARFERYVDAEDLTEEEILFLHSVRKNDGTSLTNAEIYGESFLDVVKRLSPFFMKEIYPILAQATEPQQFVIIAHDTTIEALRALLLHFDLLSQIPPEQVEQALETIAEKGIEDIMNQKPEDKLWNASRLHITYHHQTDGFHFVEHSKVAERAYEEELEAKYILPNESRLNQIAADQAAIENWTESIFTRRALEAYELSYPDHTKTEYEETIESFQADIERYLSQCRLLLESFPKGARNLAIYTNIIRAYEYYAGIDGKQIIEQAIRKLGFMPAEKYFIQTHDERLRNMIPSRDIPTLTFLGTTYLSSEEIHKNFLVDKNERRKISLSQATIAKMTGFLTGKFRRSTLLDDVLHLHLRGYTNEAILQEFSKSSLPERPVPSGYVMQQRRPLSGRHVEQLLDRAFSQYDMDALLAQYGYVTPETYTNKPQIVQAIQWKDIPVRYFFRKIYVNQTDVERYRRKIKLSEL